MNRITTRFSWMAMLGLVAVLVGSVTPAHASGAGWTWTASKARQTVIKKATVQVPAPLKASLASELQAGVRLYLALEMAAVEVGDVDALATFQRLEASYRRSLETVRKGLQVRVAACTGLGVPVRGNRFARFRCPVTSGQLEIPAVKLEYGDGQLPKAVEGSPRLEGPFQALLEIRVIGKSAITYRQLD